MKTIGLIGGMSWESTTSYYQIINETIKKELGGLHSAKILLYSVDFAEIEHYQAVGDWEKSGTFGRYCSALGASRCGLHRYLHQHHAQGCSADTRKDYDSNLAYCAGNCASPVG